MAQSEYVTSLGDMWDGIAHKVYGGERKELLMSLLLEANPDHMDTVVFRSGVRLAVPEAPRDIPANLPPWMR